MLVLSWPKHAFGLFHKIVWKTQENFLTDPIFLANAVSKKKNKTQILKKRRSDESGYTIRLTLCKRIDYWKNKKGRC